MRPTTIWLGLIAAAASAFSAWASETVWPDTPPFAAIRAFSVRGTPYLVYGDARGVVHATREDTSGAVEEWKSEPLESSIGGVFCGDLDDSGSWDALAYALTGSIVLFDIEAQQRVWHNDPGTFGRITCLTVANMDADAQKEMVFCADARLHVYDCKTLLREWTSDAEFEAQDILVGDVDDDGQLEIVLNTGFVLDARFHDVEWQTERLGDRIALFDVDGDGVAEVVGEFPSGVIRIYDMDLRQEHW